jgi:hypothetical protein
MKIYTLMLAIVIMSCTSKPDRPAAILTPDRIAAANSAEQANAAVLSTAGAVQHYYCANNCPGSGGDAAGTCPVCGSEYSHNQAWHDMQQNNVTTTTTTSDGSGPSVGITPPVQAPTEPPQNAAGVWHYTCPNGHAGGSGSATPCSECGTTLVHNSDYHN